MHRRYQSTFGGQERFALGTVVPGVVSVSVLIEDTVSMWPGLHPISHHRPLLEDCHFAGPLGSGGQIIHSATVHTFRQLFDAKQPWRADLYRRYCYLLTL